MDILYQDNSILVCIKPAGVLSTDEPGGVPELVRQTLGDPKACVRTVHRLDRVVSGLMVLARTPGAASKLSAQIREHDFGKTYLAVVHGAPSPLQGTYRDLLRRDPNERKTYVTDKMAKGVQEAVLDYEVLGTRAELSLVRIYLQTGRTHQIRVHFAALGHPLLGDALYGGDASRLARPALHSATADFTQPVTGQSLHITAPVPDDLRAFDFERYL